MTTLCYNDFKLKLRSDFRDWYDHQFDLEGIPFQRPSVKESRTEGLTLLEKMGLQVPRWGTLGDLQGHVRCQDLVVYFNPFNHRGEGKRRVDSYLALRDYDQNLLAMSYIPTQDRTESIRYLRVGTMPPCWFRYTSDDHWRSNCGNVEIERIPSPPGFTHFRDPDNIPMLAIDFVQSPYGLWAAIDYNSSPGLDPLKDIVSADTIVDALKNWYIGKGY